MQGSWWPPIPCSRINPLGYCGKLRKDMERYAKIWKDHANMSCLCPTMAWMYILILDVTHTFPSEQKGIKRQYWWMLCILRIWWTPTPATGDYTHYTHCEVWGRKRDTIDRQVDILNVCLKLTVGAELVSSGVDICETCFGMPVTVVAMNAKKMREPSCSLAFARKIPKILSQAHVS